MNEPGAEEGGEDIFVMPDTCARLDHFGLGCFGAIRALDGFMKCDRCGASYGPISTVTHSELKQIGGKVARQSKKPYRKASAAINLRLEPELKAAFMEACKHQRISQSEALTVMVQGFINEVKL